MDWRGRVVARRRVGSGRAETVWNARVGRIGGGGLDENTATVATVCNSNGKNVACVDGVNSLS